MKDFIGRLFGSNDSLDAARQRMRSDWDRRARENAMHYIADFREEWKDIDEFFRTGEDDTAKFLAEAGWTPAMTEGTSLLEIGCGMGRMTRALAGRFGHIVAVDVSAEMLVRAREANAHLQNVRFVQGDGCSFGDMPDDTFDFAISYIVFQHMPRAELIYQYIRDAIRVLKPGGRFRFQARNDFASRKPDTYDGDSIEIPRVKEIAARSGATVMAVEGEGRHMCYVELQKNSD